MRITASADLRVANRRRLADTGLPSSTVTAELSAHGPHPFQIIGRAVDGGLARLDADRGRCRPRGPPRTERVPADGDAHGHRLLPAVSLDPRQWRICDPEDRAASHPHLAQPHSLWRPDRLVLRADADP